MCERERVSVFGCWVSAKQSTTQYDRYDNSEILSEMLG